MQESEQDQNQADTETWAEVEAIEAAIRAFMNLADAQGRKIGDAKCGVYAYFGWEGSPLYVGQTDEGLLNRVWADMISSSSFLEKSGRSNYEVADVEVWPLWGLESKSAEVKTKTLDAVEASVFKRLLRGSKLGAVLIARYVSKSNLIELPPSFRGRIMPAPAFTAIEICEECGEPYDTGDDGWCGLCPDCADRKEAEEEEEEAEEE